MSRLIHEATGVVVKAGDTLQTFRGEFVILESWEDPLHAASSGRIYVRDRPGHVSSFFPSVCGCKIVGGKHA